VDSTQGENGMSTLRNLFSEWGAVQWRWIIPPFGSVFSVMAHLVEDARMYSIILLEKALYANSFD